MYPNNQRLWALTDVGALNYFGVLHLVRQQQATINALVDKVAKMEARLPAPKPPLAFGGTNNRLLS